MINTKKFAGYAFTIVLIAGLGNAPAQAQDSLQTSIETDTITYTTTWVPPQPEPRRRVPEPSALLGLVAVCLLGRLVKRNNIP